MFPHQIFYLLRSTMLFEACFGCNSILNYCASGLIWCWMHEHADKSGANPSIPLESPQTDIKEVIYRALIHLAEFIVPMDVHYARVSAECKSSMRTHF